MLRNKVKKIFKQEFGKEVEIERPNKTEHGDYSTNLALKNKIDPDKLIEQLSKHDLFDEVVKAGPGFVNMYLSKKALFQELKEILEKQKDYGQLALGKHQKIQVEFISANPTGPLTVGNARGGPYGDVLANFLAKAGYQVEKAYYVNDAGEQIRELGKSIQGDKEAKYTGEYVEEIKKKILVKEKDSLKLGQLAAKYILKDYLQKTVNNLGIRFNEWIFESDLHKSNKVAKVLKELEKKNLTYSKDKAIWFKSKQFGDERDRVLVKQNGNYTYLAGDIALHDYKFREKKFDKAINIWGADHHGDIPGIMAGVEVLGFKDKLEIILLQFVTILEKGKQKKMSKRSGNYVLMDELLEKAGQDAVRFFFLEKSSNTHLTFDIDLAQEQSAKNPVFYVQYAHARISGILKKVEQEFDLKKINLLTHPAELSLIKELIKFPEIIEDTAKDYQVQRLPYYTLDLASQFHKFYENCRVIDKENQELTQARLSLVKASQIVLKNSLDLMGISAPQKM